MHLELNGIVIVMSHADASTWPLWMRLLWQVVAVAILLHIVPARTEVDAQGVRRGRGWLYTLRPSLDDYANDFYQEWGSIRNWFTGRPIYAHHRETIPIHLGIDLGSATKLTLEYNAHPPPSVLLLLPLGWLGFLDALVAWHIVSLGCLLGSVWLMQRELGGRVDPWLMLPGLALLLLCNPVRQQFNQGQLNALLLLLLTGAWAAQRHGDQRLAGTMIGVAAAVKLFPAFLLLYFALRRQWRGVLAGVTTLLALTLATVVVLGTQTYRDYIAVVLPAIGEYRCSWINGSIVGFWHRLFVGSANEQVVPLVAAPVLAWVLTAISALGLVGVAVRVAGRAADEGQTDRAFAVFLTVMLLLGPLTWDHSLLLLVLPLWLLARDVAWSIPPRSGPAWLLTGIVAVFFVSPREVLDGMVVRGWLGVPVGPLGSATVLAIPFYALLALLLLLSLVPMARERGIDGRSGSTEPRGG